MKRGTNVALTREVPELKGVTVGIQVDAGGEHALADSMVVATILCDEHSKALSDQHFVFFNQLLSPEESVQQRDTSLGNDQEQVDVDLSSVPAEVSRIAFVVYVNDGLGPRRNLGQLRHCTIRVLDRADSRELVRSEELSALLSGENAATLGELYRHQGDWKFKVIGDGYSSGVTGLAADYGFGV